MVWEELDELELEELLLEELELGVVRKSATEAVVGLLRQVPTSPSSSWSAAAEPAPVVVAASWPSSYPCLTILWLFPRADQLDH